MKYRISIFFYLQVSILLFGCYQMDKKEELNIMIIDHRVDRFDVKYYVDSVLNKDLVIPDSVRGILYGYDNLQEFERVIYFDSDPKEYYIINFFGNPIVIVSVFNAGLSEYAIYKKDDLSEEQIERIKKRFKIELLDKVVDYTKNKSQQGDKNRN